MSPLAAWSIVILGYLLPLCHVALSRRAGPWRAPAEGRCPLSPRFGWLVLVLLLGPLGWLLFATSRRRRREDPGEPR